MAGKLEVCGFSVGGGGLGGAVIGGTAAFAGSIWTCVKYIQPALISAGLTPVQANLVTAAVAIFGYIETATGAGIVAGAGVGCIAAPIVVGTGYCLKGTASAAKSVWQNTGSSTFFRQEEKSQTDVEPKHTASPLPV